LIKESRTEN